MNMTLKDCIQAKELMRKQILAIERTGTQRANKKNYALLLESEKRLDRQIQMLQGGLNNDRANFRTF